MRGGALALPRVAVFSLGGTISSIDSGGKGVEPTLTGEALVSDVPQIAEVAEVSADSFRQAASGELTLNDLIELAAEIEGRVDEGASGAVVTQGTDAIEETAFVLDLLVDRAAPVVVTGAMRNPTLPGADGPANLLASIQVAASEVARDLGAVVVLNDEIHAARFARKTHTSNPATFRSDPVGPVGWVSEDVPRVVLRPVGRHKISLPEDAQNRPVALHTVALGDDGRLLPAIEESGIRRTCGRGHGRRPRPLRHGGETRGPRREDAGHPGLAHRGRRGLARDLRVLRLRDGPARARPYLRWSPGRS